MPNEPENALTFDQVADIYDRHHRGRPARTLQIDTVLDRAEREGLIQWIKDGDYYIVTEKGKA